LDVNEVSKMIHISDKWLQDQTMPAEVASAFDRPFSMYIAVF